MSDATILVTGANGFLGSYLVRTLLKSSPKVRVLLRSGSEISLLKDIQHRLEIYRGDVLDIPSLETALSGCKQVYHAAAMISFKPEHRKQMRKTNVEGTANVVNAAAWAGVEKLLHVSSVAAFGRASKNRLISESYPGSDDPENYDYHRSKFYAENEVWRANAEGLSTIIINPSTILGAGKWNYPPLTLFREIDRGIPFISSGMQGFVDVRDVAEMGVRLMNSEATAERFILSAENMEFHLLANEIAKAMNRKPISNKLPAWLHSPASWYEHWRSRITGSEARFNTAMLKLSSENYSYDSSKVTGFLNHSFRPLRQTIADTVAAYRVSVNSNVDFAVFPSN